MTSISHLTVTLSPGRWLITQWQNHEQQHVQTVECGPFTYVKLIKKKESKERPFFFCFMDSDDLWESCLFDFKTPLLLPLMIYVWWIVSCSSPPLGHRQTFPTTWQSSPLQRTHKHNHSSEIFILYCFCFFIPLILVWREGTSWTFYPFSVKKTNKKKK